MNDFDINHKNEQYKQVRQCFGQRSDEVEKVINNEKQIEAMGVEAGKGIDVYQSNVQWMKMSQINFEGRREGRLHQLIHDKQIKRLQEKKFRQVQETAIDQQRGIVELRDGMDSLDKNRDQSILNEFAVDLFGFWDSKKDGQIAVSEVVKDMIAIGLAPGEGFLLKMISIALKLPLKDLSSQFFSQKDFQKLSQSSRLVARILKVLNENVKDLLLTKKQLLRQTTNHT